MGHVVKIMSVYQCAEFESILSAKNGLCKFVDVNEAHDCVKSMMEAKSVLKIMEQEQQADLKNHWIYST